MKAILGVLLCYVLFASECFAHKGGPFEGGKGQISIPGTYAVILIPTDGSVNSLGLATLVIPSVGLASGTTAFFTQGAFYSGTIQGAADPKSDKLYAVIDSVFTRTVIIDAAGDTEVFVSTATGELNGNKIVSGRGFPANRITGDATMEYTSDDPAVLPLVPNGTLLTYSILGFKQA